MHAPTGPGRIRPASRPAPSQTPWSTTRPLSRAEQIDAATPATRNRVVGLLRAAAITVVVLGHWSIMAVDVDGGIMPHGILDDAP